MASVGAVLKRLSYKLVEPPKSVEDPSERDRMALLSAILLGMALANVPPVIVTAGYQAPLGALLTLLLGCYALSRTPRYKIAAVITIVVCTGLQAFLISKKYDPSTAQNAILMDAAWMIVPLIIASVFLALRKAMLYWAFLIGEVTLRYFVISPELRIPATPTLVFIVIIGGLILAAAWLRSRDTRRLKAQGEELRTAKEAAEAATVAKSQFLANMSHEIRTPMNAVIGMAGLLGDTKLSPRQHELVETIRTSGGLLLSIINDILDFSKINAGRLELEKAPFDLHDLVARAFSLVSEAAYKKRLDLAYEIVPGTPEIVVGDAVRLQQVLINLLTNATKFTEQGEVVLTVRANGPVAPDAVVELEIAVRDTGIGIPEDRMNKLFLAFGQVDPSTTRHYGGTGLGLAISKQLVELMGGRIWVESKPGVGSTFHFTITALAGREEKKDAPTAAEALAGRRLLIVDDNLSNRRILSTMAESWGVISRSAESGPHALELLTSDEQFDAAIIDLHMPGMDGKLLAKTIRHLGGRGTLPLILLTSAGIPANETSDLFAAAIQKPVHPGRLQRALVEVLKGERHVTFGDRSPPDSPPRVRLAQSHPLRILIADDNEMNQRVLRFWLESFGYAPDLVDDGDRAVEAIRSHPYDLVFMDVQMPRMDGLAATRAIREALPEGARPRIVALSAAASPSERQACLAAGMDQFMSKPFQPSDLVSAIESCSPVSRGLKSGEDERAPPESGLRPLSILVAEDNVVNQRLTTFVLESMGHGCAIAENGRKAVDAVRSGLYDLVLMDCQMPEMDGYQATVAIRREEPFRAIPIIALTAQTLPGDRERCLASGMDGYIAKPFEREHLEAEMTRVLTEKLGAVPKKPAAPSASAEVPLVAPGALVQLREMRRVSPATAAELVELFLSEGMRLSAALRAASRSNDSAQARRVCHELIGAAATLGAERTAALVKELQSAAKQGDLATVDQGLSRLEGVIRDTHHVFESAMRSG